MFPDEWGARVMALREEMEEILYQEVLEALGVGYQLLLESLDAWLQPEKADPWEDVLRKWEEEFRSVFEEALLRAAERGWSLVVDLGGGDFSPQEVLRTYYALPEKELPLSTLRDQVRQELIAWFTSQGTYQELTQALQKYFSPQRARMIARTEAGKISSILTDLGMQAGQVSRWVWMTRLEINVCPRCRALHGMVFKRGDPMPPLHPNCLCFPAPLIE